MDFDLAAVVNIDCELAFSMPGEGEGKRDEMNPPSLQTKTAHRRYPFLSPHKKTRRCRRICCPSLWTSVARSALEGKERCEKT